MGTQFPLSCTRGNNNLSFLDAKDRIIIDILYDWEFFGLIIHTKGKSMTVYMMGSFVSSILMTFYRMGSLVSTIGKEQL